MDRLNNQNTRLRETFSADILKIFANARVYNLPDTIYVKAANELEEFIAPYLLALKDDRHIGETEIKDSDKTVKKGVPGMKKKIKKEKSH